VLHLRQIPHHCLAYRITVANEIVKVGSHVDCNLQSSVAIDAYGLTLIGEPPRME